MGHHIRAIIGKIDNIQKFADNDCVCAKVIGLPQNMGMVMLTEKLFEELEERSVEMSRGDPCSELDGFDGTAAGILERYSLNTKLAYIETDYFGGAGTQGGVLYSDGRETISARVGEGTVNLLLRELGVCVLSPDMDEFDCLGLGQYRYMDE